jgi:hypothetical protein
MVTPSEISGQATEGDMRHKKACNVMTLQAGKKSAVVRFVLYEHPLVLPQLRHL